MVVTRATVPCATGATAPVLCAAGCGCRRHRFRRSLCWRRSGGGRPVRGLADRRSGRLDGTRDGLCDRCGGCGTGRHNRCRRWRGPAARCACRRMCRLPACRRRCDALDRGIDGRRYRLGGLRHGVRDLAGNIRERVGGVEVCREQERKRHSRYPNEQRQRAAKHESAGSGCCRAIPLVVPAVSVHPLLRLSLYCRRWPVSPAPRCLDVSRYLYDKRTMWSTPNPYRRGMCGGFFIRRFDVSRSARAIPVIAVA